MNVRGAAYLVTCIATYLLMQRTRFAHLQNSEPRACRTFNVTPAVVLLRFNKSHHRRHPYEVGCRPHSSANNVLALHVRLQHQHQCSNLTRHGMDTRRRRLFGGPCVLYCIVCEISDSTCQQTVHTTCMHATVPNLT